MNYGVVKEIEKIENFEEKLEKAKKDNWQINNIIGDAGNGNFEDLDERMQKMIISWILDH